MLGLRAHEVDVGKKRVVRKKNPWRWLEAFIILFMILATVAVGEGIYRDSVESQAEMVDAKSPRKKVPVVFQPPVHPFTMDGLTEDSRYVTKSSGMATRP